MNPIIHILSGHKVHVSGNEIYMFYDTSLDFIEKCKMKQVEILGIELFEFNSDGTIAPIISKIADFSQTSKTKCYSLSKEFISIEMTSEMVANFVLD